MQVREIIAILEQIAPLRYAEPWDNVGLLAGDEHGDGSRVLLAIDYTAEVAREAIDGGYGLVVAYHPPLFSPIRRFTSDHPLFETVRRGVAVYSPHTALDAAPGGTNDVLADALGIRRRAPIRWCAPPADDELKLVTFVPSEHLESLSAALFSAGAGHIGNYRQCSFRHPGQGTFFGAEGSDPAVGQKGRLETVDEIRLETVVPLARVRDVVAALRQAHPYEEPAFDLVRLAPHPGSSAFGMGRIGEVGPSERRELVARAGRALGIGHLLVAGPTEGAATRAAVCAGSAGDLLDAAIAQGAELVLTGEVKHHDALRAARAGVTVVATLHSNSERKALGWLRSEIARLAPAASVTVSKTDRDPFAVVSVT